MANNTARLVALALVVGALLAGQGGSLILVVGLVGLASPAAADPRRKSPFIVDAGGEKSPIIDPQKVTVVIRVNNVVGIEPGLLRFAEVRATDVFSQIGVRLTWVNAPTPAMCTLALVNTHQNPVGPYSDVQDALGYAEPQLHRAWIFWDRFDALSPRPVSLAIVLGDAMAHELGHLMLSSRGHSVDGIMRPIVELQFRSTETFTKSQARDILTRLEQTCTVTDSNH
jgi:hypothetical protein